ncbi:hypothetical protein BU26DRAFT_555230 [Trematosphaeria pertusa]|uniref:Uncharacterized protein n=1 Tax=Trematosphaeria pertusa TaxID=390896 RepID=A0A6A6HZE0_9PLEO|nr:uncharacterized protein BU26DRAFT_555230 [Trematosphaeria pertusa]KAF2243138.1 hypothetical protein BU26DRAFT_555230 [Trematosphaeria pertusa]
MLLPASPRAPSRRPSSPEPWPLLDFLPLSPTVHPQSGIGSPLISPLVSPQRSRATTLDSTPLERTSFPIFRIQLTLFYYDRERIVKSNTTIIKGHYFTAQHANKAALDLAKCCRSEGDVVMLMDQKVYSEKCRLKNKFVIGKWEADVDAAACNLRLMDEVQTFMWRKVEGVLSGVVRILEGREADLSRG